MILGLLKKGLMAYSAAETEFLANSFPNSDILIAYPVVQPCGLPFIYFYFS